LKNSVNYILIDAPGTSISSDALTLAQISDAVILVIEANKTRRIAALKAKNMFDVAGVRLLGTILNNRTLPIPESVYRRL
jgi:Mrp family chromosome partitioning ATPase